MKLPEPTAFPPMPQTLPAPVRTICYPFPMRSGRYLAQVLVPMQMTKDEAERLCAFVMSLATPDTANPGDH